MRQCRQLWRGERDQLSPAFICSYIMVICLGLRTVADSLPGMANALTLADKLYRVAEGVLWCSRFMSRHTFESLQAISLLTVYGFAMDDGGDGTWTLCGAAIKIGQNLGLNRLEAEGKNKDWDPQWNSLLKREMARRVWWTFVSLDWSHAISHGSTCELDCSAGGGPRLTFQTRSTRIRTRQHCLPTSTMISSRTKTLSLTPYRCTL